MIWGGVVALTFSGIANSCVLSFLQHVVPAATVDSWGAALVAPVNEELYKGAGLVLIYLMARREFDGVMDGLVYGAMIGLGFQVMENVQYFMFAAAESGGGQLGSVVSMFFLRVVLSRPLQPHAVHRALGFGFAYFVTQRDRAAGRDGWQWPCSVRGAGLGGAFRLELTLARVAHGAGHAGLRAWRWSSKGCPSCILLVLLGVFARRRERQVFARLMRSEVGSDVCQRGEFHVLQSGRRRRAGPAAREEGEGAAGARSCSSRLMREQMNLALFHAKVPSRRSSGPGGSARHDQAAEGAAGAVRSSRLRPRDGAAPCAGARAVPTTC